MKGHLLGAAPLAMAVAFSTVVASPQSVQKTALVTVVAEATGRAADLTGKDFVVREDEAAREVVAAAPATEPLYIMLLVDTTQPQGGIAPTQDLRRGLTAFVEIVKSASPDAQIAIMGFAGAAVMNVDLTPEKAALASYIDRLFPNQQSDAVLIEALVDAGKRLGDKPSPRRAIVSVDFNSPDSSAPHTMRRAGEDIRKAGATVWAISVRGTNRSTSTREEVLNVVTQSSGGLRLTAVDAPGLEPMLKSVANSLLSQYTVTFVRPNSGSVTSTQMETAKGGKVLVTPWMR